MASYVEIDRYCNPVPVSLTFFSACPCPYSSRTLILTRRPASRLNLRLVLDGSKSMHRIRCSILAVNRPTIKAVVRSELGGVDDGEAKEEVDKGNNLSMEGNPVSDHQHKASQLKKRIVFGLGIGFSVGGIVLAGARLSLSPWQLLFLLVQGNISSLLEVVELQQE